LSIVEQTILRLKRTSFVAAADATAELPVLNMSVGAIQIDAPPEIEAPIEAKPARRITVDQAALRAAGYLPEAGEERRFAEFYRQIKRPLIESAFSVPSGDRERRLIMISSALPGDGKTFTTINLALSIARERDVSVLLVDADALKQHVSEIFGLKREPGLLDALTDERANVKSLVVATNLRGLSILPAGRFVEGTAELFASNRMRVIVNTLLAQNPRRIVLFDSPPLLITNEGRSLVKIAGQVALVVRAGTTPRGAMREAVGMIDERQAGGIVLNQGHIGLTDGYYGYGTYGVDNDENAAKR
jgi:exopolysaccharide/PEP-CTERM locus tyrosine autokinase